MMFSTLSILRIAHGERLVEDLLNHEHILGRLQAAQQSVGCSHFLFNTDHFIDLSKENAGVSNIEQRSRQPKAHAAEITARPSAYFGDGECCCSRLPLIWFCAKGGSDGKSSKRYV